MYFISSLLGVTRNYINISFREIALCSTVNKTLNTMLLTLLTCQPPVITSRFSSCVGIMLLSVSASIVRLITKILLDEPQNFCVLFCSKSYADVSYDLSSANRGIWRDLDCTRLNAFSLHKSKSEIITSVHLTLPRTLLLLGTMYSFHINYESSLHLLVIKQDYCTKKHFWKLFGETIIGFRC